MPETPTVAQLNGSALPVHAAKIGLHGGAPSLGRVESGLNKRP